MKTIKRDIASAVIMSIDHKILLGQKNPAGRGVYSEGFWLIPGGGVEPGETTLQALHREIMEEVGLDIRTHEAVLIEDQATSSVSKTLDTGEQVTVHMQFFTYEIRLEEPAAAVAISPSDELPILEWVPEQELASRKLPPPSVALFTKIGLLT